jgi:hypothetical protein
VGIPLEDYDQQLEYETDMEQDQALEELSWNLILSFFNQRKGPEILFRGINPQSIKKSDLDTILQNLDYQIEEETFIFGFRKNWILNYLFNIYSESARAQQHLLMISYLIREEYIKRENIDTFKLLEQKKQVLKDYAEDLKKLENLQLIIRAKEDYRTNVEPSVYNRFQTQFSQLYKTYYEKLEPSSDLSKKFEIACPICGTSKEIDIPEQIINHEYDSITLSIPKYRICEHSFLLCLKIINKQLKIDSIKKIEPIHEKSIIDSKFKLSDNDIIKIKSTFKPETLIKSISSVFFKIPITSTQITEHFALVFQTFLKYIFQNSFRVRIKITRDYDSNGSFEISINNDMLDDIGVNKNPVFIENFKFINKIVKNFYSNNDPLLSLDNLRHEISLIFALTQEIYNFTRDRDFTNITRKQLVLDLLDTFLIRIDKKYFLSFLIEIVDNYFGVKIKFTQDLIAQKIDEMWGK